MAVVAVVGLLAYWSANSQINEVYDGQLVAGANVVLALMHEELAEADVEAGTSRTLDFDKNPLSPEDRRAFEAFADWRMFRIWHDGKLIMGSDTGPDGISAKLAAGFHDLGNADQSWRVYMMEQPGQHLAIAVGERLDARGELIRRVSIELLLPLLILLPACAGLIWYSLSDGLRALRKLIAAVGRKSERELSPLRIGPTPRDLEPLVSSIDGLLVRLRKALDESRMFTDLASHQLRTPLAALKLQSQMAAREPDGAERQVLVQNIQDGVDRMTYLVEQLLTLARLDSGTAMKAECDLRGILKVCLEGVAPLAAQEQVELELADSTPAYVIGDPALVLLVFSNLIENALKFSPKSGAVRVALDRLAKIWRVTIADQGPGIPEQEQQRVFDRFYKRTQGVPGAGLGLAIVKEALRAMGGSIVLANNTKNPGLAAIVELPAA